MTTRSGIRYRREESSLSEGGESVDLAHMMKALLEDRQHHEEELIEEQRRHEEENKAREAELREERLRREEDLAKRGEESRKQMLLLQAPVEGVKKQGEAAARKAESDKDVRVAKLTENDDIEAYLTTFERLMVAYEVKKDSGLLGFQAGSTVGGKSTAGICWVFSH